MSTSGIKRRSLRFQPLVEGQIAFSDILAENDYAVVYFYNQDGSTGCSIEAERFNQAQEQFKAKKARVLGVSMDSIESRTKAFAIRKA